ncbi:hypothetical protein HN51_065770 [Arachis hypogaea]
MAETEGTESPHLSSSMNGKDSSLDGGLEFYITDEKGIVKDSKISMNEPLEIKILS